jgi:polysaccharide deacetylase family protein (PEP-CTERM system associated)
MLRLERQLQGSRQSKFAIWKGKALNIAITVDIEDWFQLKSFKEQYPFEKWSTSLLRLDEPLDKLLELFEAYDVKGTFFALGWYGIHYPELLRKIKNKGHEIGSHGMTHVLNSEITDEVMSHEVKDSKKVLEEAIQSEVIGYRATSFTVSDKFIDLLVLSGYRYDSSYFPFKGNSQYGSLSTRKLEEISKIGFKEFSMPMGRYMGRQIPFSGGAYFRFLPTRIIEKAIETCSQDPIVMYFHPWEFDKGLLKIKGLKPLPRLRHFYGIKRNFRKLGRIIDQMKDKSFSFSSLGELL